MFIRLLKQLWSRNAPPQRAVAARAPSAGERESALLRHLDASPQDADAWYELGALHEQSPRPAAALAAYERALALDPAHAWASLGAAGMHDRNNEFERALGLYHRALPLAPKQAAQIHARIGALLRRRGDAHAAIESYRAAIRVRDDIAEIHYNFALALNDCGYIEDAVGALQRALALREDFALAHSTLLCICGLNRQWPPQRVLEEHRRWAARHADPLAAMAAPHDNPRDPGRRLNIGYVSADFREHSVSFFIEPVLAAHDRLHFRIFCYDNFSGTDAVNRRLQTRADVWRKIDGLDDNAAAATIRADGIDILVDLSGHTAGNRLGVFARKPAPVQATWFGYMCTTGMTAIDYRITDANLDPPGETEQFYSETLLRLPCAVAFSPAADCPTVNALPALTRGYPTLASFNNYTKIGDAVVALWARILATLPVARLLLVAAGGDDPAMRNAVAARFAAFGADPRQLNVIGRRSLDDFFKLFHEVDLALDPFPYSGGTTSLHTLWMGVPIVALEGDSEIARSTSGMLHAVGLDHLAVRSEDAYHDAVVTLARDPAQLVTLRTGLRQRMTASCLCNAAAVTASLEAVYRDIWNRWCMR